MNRYCIVCGTPITKHHHYCEKHYPDKTNTIKSLNKTIKEQRKEIQRLNNQIETLKRGKLKRSTKKKYLDTIKDLNRRIKILEEKNENRTT